MVSKVRVLTRFYDVRQHLASICAFADSEKGALGFLPTSAFEDQAHKGRLWVALCDKSDDCVGYLLFGGKYPLLKVFQLFVRPGMRSQGIGAELIEQLVGYGEKHNYQGIRVRVAADLPANSFWDKTGFLLTRQEPGGKSTGRMINVWFKQLEGPTLFRPEVPEIASGIERFRAPAGPVIPNDRYVIDLNVLFDITKDRTHRDQAACVIGAALNQDVRLVVTPELTRELERKTRGGGKDPVLEFARNLPTLPQIDLHTVEALCSELRPIVFPSKTPEAENGERVSSDLIHLAYCIHHCVTGFLTRDSDILAASDEILRKYPLEILSPLDLVESFAIAKTPLLSIRASLECADVSIQPIFDDERNELEGMLCDMGVGHNAIRAALESGTSTLPRRRVVVRVSGKLIGMASWDHRSRLKRSATLHVYVDERSSGAEQAIDHILAMALRDSPPSLLTMLTLRTLPDLLQTISTARNIGFFRSPPTKLSYSGVVFKDSWADFVDQFAQILNFRLSDRMPDFDEFTNTGVRISEINGKSPFFLKLFDFESVISPGIVLCAKREGLIVPIQNRFARDLLQGTDPQMNLFPSPEAILRLEKAYFRSPSRTKLFERGKPVVFYLSGASGGTKEAIGCGRVTWSDVLTVADIGVNLKRQGVLPSKMLKEMADKYDRLQVFTFVDYVPFVTRISFAELRSMNAVSGASLVTAQSLSARELLRVCKRGFCCE